MVLSLLLVAIYSPSLEKVTRPIKFSWATIRLNSSARKNARLTVSLTLSIIAGLGDGIVSIFRYAAKADNKASR